MIGRIALTISLALALSLGLAAPATAQEAPDPRPAASPVELSSARATMRAFLEAMRDAAAGRPDRLDDAAACLDLSGVNEAIRHEKGRELALQLKTVIDRVRFVDFAEIPDVAEGAAFVFHSDHEGLGEVVISRQADGRWKFTAATVAALPELVRSLEGLEAVKGATAVPFHLAPALWLRAHVPQSMRR